MTVTVEPLSMLLTLVVCDLLRAKYGRLARRYRRPRTFYVATGVERTAEANAAAKQLLDAGWRQTYRWAEHGAVREPTFWPGVAQRELTGVVRADVVVVLLPGLFGTHGELGAALARGTPVLLYATEEQLARPGSNGVTNCIFYHHPLVRRLDPWLLGEKFAGVYCGLPQQAARWAREAPWRT